jgi:hypothetical protein
LSTYWKKEEFHVDFNNLSLVKKNKIESILSSIKPLFKWIKEKNIKTIVSHQTLNDLNYLHLETLYLGLPLIHNSETLKEYGYYYTDYSVNKGAEQLKNVILNHKNNDKYLDKCKECIYKFSIYNKNNILSYEKLLSDIYNL